ncbi:MAG TPA: enolase C-terminal domain-like protein [Acidimicrobiia bacterium]|nr:enolase C-terminal domain-like protein [Acidimicrobiia bacterium]
MIERIHLHEIEVEFTEPLVTPDGTFPTRRSVLVGVEASGTIGWGEAPAFPSRRWGTADAAWEALATAPVLDGAEPLPPIAAAALQAARADLAARLAGEPLHLRLGGSTRPVRARHTVGLTEDPDSLVARVGVLVRDGIAAVKIKIRPGWDLGQITAVSTAFPSLDVSVDANATYRDPDDPVFDALAERGVSLVEQPFAAGDLAAHAALRRRGVLRVGLDESIRSAGDARHILEAGAADVLSVKVNRLGLNAARKILELAEAAGTGVKVGGTFDTAMGRRLLLAFSTLDGVTDAEIAPPAGYLAKDVADYPPLLAGRVTPDEAPGIGAAPDKDRLAALEIRRTTIGG